MALVMSLLVRLVTLGRRLGIRQLQDAPGAWSPAEDPVVKILVVASAFVMLVLLLTWYWSPSDET